MERTSNVSPRIAAVNRMPTGGRRDLDQDLERRHVSSLLWNALFAAQIAGIDDDILTELGRLHSRIVRLPRRGAS